MQENTQPAGDPDLRMLFLTVATLGVIGFGGVLLFGGYRLIEGPGTQTATHQTPASPSHG